MNTALLIDDDEGIRQSLEAAANDLKLHLETAASWDEGLALFHVHSPDLVIADYNLPGSNHGLRLLYEVKSLRPSVRVILISGVVDATKLREAEELGLVDKVLSKGTSIETTKILLDEMQRTQGEGRSQTDWKSFGQAFVENRSVDQAAFDALDAALRSQAENRSL